MQWLQRALAHLELELQDFVKNNTWTIAIALVAFIVLGLLGVSIDPTTGAIISISAALLLIGFVVTVWRRQSAEADSRSIFSIIDPKLRRVSYLKISPPIIISTGSTHVHCRVRPYRFRIAPPEDLGSILEEVAKLIEPGREDRDDIISALRNRFAEGNFAATHEPRPIDLERTAARVYARILNDEVRFDAARKKALVDYLMRNGFGFNGVFIAVNTLKETRDDRALHEVPALDFTLQPTDYYTFRVLSELASSGNLREYGMPEIQGDELTEYCAGDFQDHIQASFGVAISVHTLKDDRLIVTRRSGNTGNPLDEAGKYFMSANEGLNRFDLDPNTEFSLKPGTIYLTEQSR